MTLEHKLIDGHSQDQMPGKQKEVVRLSGAEYLAPSGFSPLPGGVEILRLVIRSNELSFGLSNAPKTKAIASRKVTPSFCSDVTHFH